MNGIVLMSLALAATPGEADDLSAWVARARGQLANTPTAQTLEASREAAEHALRAATEQSPWTLRALATHGQQLPRNGTSFIPRLGQSVPTTRSWEATVTGGVEYQSRSRWSVALEGAAGYFDNRDVPGAQANDLPFNVDLSVTYDVVGGGAGSAENEAARAEALAALGRRLATRDGLLQADLQLLEQVVALFGNRCKLAALAPTAAAADKALKEARLQVETKVIGKADALNYEFLADSVASRRAALLLEGRALLARARVWGPELGDALAALASSNPACGEGVDAALARAAWAPQADAALDELAAGLPGPAARRAAESAAGLSAAALRMGQRLSLAPFLLGRVSRAIGYEDEVGLVEAGVQLDWNLPGERGQALLQAAEAQRRAAGQAAMEAQVAARAQVRQVVAELQAEQELLQALARTVQHSSELEQVLEVQRAIGEVSSLNQAVAVANQVEARLAYVDSWLRLRLGLLRLEALERAAEAAGPDVARATDTAWMD
jgi:hypothetical protein